MELTKVKLGHSPLTDTIFLYRHGKDPALALDKREADADVMAVLVAHMMHDAPKGSEKVITLGNKQYTIRVTPNAALKGDSGLIAGVQLESTVMQKED
jgi:hypothetical protein